MCVCVCVLLLLLLLTRIQDYRKYSSGIARASPVGLMAVRSVTGQGRASEGVVPSGGVVPGGRGGGGSLGCLNVPRLDLFADNMRIWQGL